MSVVEWLKPPLISIQPNKKATAEAAASGATALFHGFRGFRGSSSLRASMPLRENIFFFNPTTRVRNAYASRFKELCVLWDQCG